MKKLLFLSVITILFFASCKKDNTIYRSYFWTSMDSSTVKMDIYIDGEYKEAVQYLSETPGFNASNNDSLLKTMTPVLLPVGTYNFEAKDTSGVIKYSSTVKIKNGGSVICKSIKGDKMDIYGDEGYLLFGIIN